MTAAGDDEQRSTHDDMAATLPRSDEFYRHVLRHLPSPVVVLDDQGKIIYVNEALLDLGGWQRHHVIDHDFLAFMHPGDRDVLASTFAEIANNPEARVLGGRPWAEIFLRIVTADGSTLPIELVGNGGLLDETVAGIIYEMRAATSRELEGRVLDGLGQGASMEHLLSLVVEMIASPPLDLQAVIFQLSPDGEPVVVASTSQLLAEAVRLGLTSLPNEQHGHLPIFMSPASMPAAMVDAMKTARFQDVWHLGIGSPLTESALQLVAAAPSHHSPPNGPVERLVRAGKLATVALVRTQADRHVDYAAAHDPLTNLPNSAEFYQRAESLDPMTERAALHLDLDGLMRVNSELGQSAGDAVVQVVADRLRVTCSPDDIIARIGGDEFIIVLTATHPGETTGESLGDRSLRLASEVLSAIQDTVVVAGRPLNLSTSIGVAIASPGVSTDHLLTWADAAMHDAKALGGGRICRVGLGYD